MLYIRPPSLDEMEKVEDEVFKELDGVESSFTTQRKVFQFLLNDYETTNSALKREQTMYCAAFNRIPDMAKDIEKVNNEIEQLHQLVIFLGNQLNQRISLSNSSLSSTSSENESICLDKMMEDLQKSSTQSQSAQKESPTCESDEVISTLTENILLKDEMIQHLEEKLKVQSEQNRKILDEKNLISQLLHIIQLFISRDSVFSVKPIDNVHVIKEPTSLPPKTPQTSQTAESRSYFRDTKEQLIAVRKEEHNRFLSGTSHRRFVQPKSTNIPRKIMDRYGYKGGGLGKNEDGITSPIAARRQIRFAESSTSTSPSPSAESPREQHEKKPWPTGTTLILGDSMISGVNERGLTNYNGKVSCQPGATIQDMYDYSKPLLKKKPDNIIIHVSTNDAPFKPADKIVYELINLRSHIEQSLPSCKVFISCPIFRTDHKLANSTIRQVNSKLKLLNRVIVNDTIDATCLGKKGLHLNKEGSRRLAKNFMSHMQGV